ncbi:hypothetical protein BJ170DRAFT_680554 [Xylariales sp. AK1849]|nr:hypothetical protein BJ170DRAFT_680554 [Xylariales sp. AK1849]
MPSSTHRSKSVTIDQLPSIQTSLDPILFSSPHRYPQLVKREARETLRRSKSLPHPNDPAAQDDSALPLPEDLARSPSPVKANSQRRRSVAPAGEGRSQLQRSRSGKPGLKTKRRYTQGVESRSHHAASCPRSIVKELATSRQNSGKEPQSASQRTQSRGRSLRRTSTPDHVLPETRKERAASRQSTATKEANTGHSRSTKGRKRRAKPADGSLLDQLTSSGQPDQTLKSRKSARIVKGVFLVKEDPKHDEFNFPASRSQPELSWRPGDGFSADEAKSDFMVFCTGKNKRKRPSSLPGMGNLSVESDPVQSGSVRASGKRQRVSEFHHPQLLRGEKKDAWPTYHDFMDSTLPNRPKRAPLAEDEEITIPDSFRPETRVFEPRSTIKFLPQYDKGALDFRNFSNPEPQVRSTLVPALERMRAWRMSSPVEDPRSAREDADREYAKVSRIPESDCGSDSDDEPSDSNESNQSVRSYWDADGNHVYPDDIRQEGRRPGRNRRCISSSSEQEDDEENKDDEAFEDGAEVEFRDEEECEDDERRDGEDGEEEMEEEKGGN